MKGETTNNLCDPVMTMRLAPEIWAVQTSPSLEGCVQDYSTQVGGVAELARKVALGIAPQENHSPASWRSLSACVQAPGCAALPVLQETLRALGAEWLPSPTQGTLDFHTQLKERQLLCLPWGAAPTPPSGTPGRRGLWLRWASSRQEQGWVTRDAPPAPRPQPCPAGSASLPSKVLGFALWLLSFLRLSCGNHTLCPRPPCSPPAFVPDHY